MESTMTMTMAVTMTSLKSKPMPPRSPYLPHSLNSTRTFKSLSLASPSVAAPTLVDQFDPTIPVERAVHPPSSWYTDPAFYAQELDSIFYRGWQAVGYVEQVKNPGDFFTGRLGDVEFVVCRDEHGKLQAFHNVCRHHATFVAYAWTYGLDGALLKAPRITVIQNFNKHEFGLTPIKVATWGPFVLANMEPEVDSDAETVVSEWLGSSSDVLIKSIVSCDNYLDGGYHVPYAHKDLASGLKLDSYSTKVYEKVSIQECEAGSKEGGNDDRLGSKVLYAFVYPNFMINRYGPWLDTNLVIPLGHRKCRVIFDYFLEASVKDDKDYIERSLKDSEKS